MSQHIIDYVHEDPAVGRDLELRLRVDIDPGQSGITRLDPGRCEPAIAESVVVERFEVIAVTLSQGDLIRLSINDRSLGPLAARALACEFIGRYHVDNQLREAIDAYCLRQTRGDRDD